MALSRLAELLGVDPAGLDAQFVVVRGVTHDSTDVRAGDLFAALPGARHHGSEFVADAVQRGAAAVLTDEVGRGAAEAAGVPAIVVPDPRAVLGHAAAEI